MKRYILMMLWMNTMYLGNYVVYSNGEVLQESHMHEQQSIASTSKIMTALVALEQNELSDIVIVDDETTKQPGSSIYLQKDEKYTLLSLLFGLMLRSGNDAAYLIAIHTSGSIETFAQLMNEKAKEIGMNNTLFRNPSGLDEEDGGNISTCYDLALLMEEAMKNDVFRIIMSSKQYQAENHRNWINKNKLLFDYEYANGGKTGYTLQAGKTLVTSANYNDFETIVVSFREPEYFSLHKNLHQSIYDSYQQIELINTGKYQVLGRDIIIPEPLYIIYKDILPEINTYYQKDKVCIEYEGITNQERKCYAYGE